MVVILNHAITAAILYYIDKDRFRISCENQPELQDNMMGITEHVQVGFVYLILSSAFSESWNFDSCMWMIC